MSYTVLARKLRPDSFAALVGQDHVVRALSHGLDEDRLHHAYLFTGTRGVGKTTIARILAKALNCEEGVSASPCGVCGRCQEVAQNRFVDLIEVDAASRTGIDDTRELLENAQYLPSVGRYKVYLIDEVHMLSKPAFNALLKTLEEPPEHVKFLLATTDPKKVPVTVLSRCLQFQLKNLSPSAIAQYLAKVLTEEKIKFDESGLEIIARAAAGSMRDALSLTDQAIGYGQGRVLGAEVGAMLGSVGRDEIGALMTALAGGEAPPLLDVVAELADRAVDFNDVLAGLVDAFHKLAVAQSLGEQVEYDFAPEVVQLNYQIALMGIRDMQVVPDPRLGMEMTLLRMLSFAPAEVPAAAGTDSVTANAAKSSGRSPGAKQSKGEVAPAKKPVKAAAVRSEPGGPANAEHVATVDISTATPEVTPPELTTSEVTSAETQRAPEILADQASWYELAEQLELGGVARMLVEHSVLSRWDGDTLGLLLDPAHDMLLSDAQVRSVQRAVQAVLGENLNFTLTAAPAKTAFAVATPAQHKAELAALRLAQAETSLQHDGTVQALLDDFGATVDQVTPIESNAESKTGSG